MGITKYILFAVMGIPLIAHSDDCSTYPQQPGFDAEVVDGFAIPRLIATGTAIPFSGDADDVADAMDEARDNAYQEMTQYMAMLVSSSIERDRVTEKITQQSGQTREASKSSVTTIVQRWERSSGAVLRGVVLLGRCYTPPNLVMVTVGIKPETFLAAEGMSAAMADSITNTPTLRTMPSGGQANQGASGLKGEGQTEAPPEEDNLRRVEGFSESSRLKNF